MDSEGSREQMASNENRIYTCLSLESYSLLFLYFSNREKKRTQCFYFVNSQKIHYVYTEYYNSISQLKYTAKNKIIITTNS